MSQNVKDDNISTKYRNLGKFCGLSHQSVQLLLSSSGTRLETSQAGLAVKILYQGSNRNLVNEVNFLRWISFIESEIRHYNTGSTSFCNSLKYLENHLGSTDFLSGGSVKAEDIFLATYLEERGIERRKYPQVSSWIERSLSGYTSPQSNQRKSKDNSSGGKKSKSGSEAKKMKPLKILCLHGYRQSGTTFRAKLGSFRKFAGKFADLTFITAPNKISDEEYGWWFSSKQCSFDAHQESDCEDGFEDSLRLISETFEKEGPFHGILSFSQGASLGASLCALQEQGKLPYSFHFSIIVAGFVSRNVRHKEIFRLLQQTSQGQVKTPSLHVFGSTDKVIEREMSEDLLQYFSDPERSEHEGGHFLPASGQTKQDLTAFLQKMQLLHQ